jgi:outer membrane protease
LTITKNTAYSHNMRTIPTFVFFVSVFCGLFLAPSMIQNVYSQTPASGSGQASRFGFSTYAQTGIFYGQSEEIVYRNSQDRNYLSQLLWDMKPLVYVGAGASFSRNRFRDALGLYMDLSFKAGIPTRTGRMEDRDWKVPSTLTNYSVHDNYTTRAFLMDFAMGVSLPLRFRDRIFAFLEAGGVASYSYFDWTAQDGYYQYDETNGWDSSVPKIPVYGDQIAYYQHWLTLSPSVAVVIPIWSRWLVEVSLKAAPGSIWVWSLDEHIGRQIEFQDRPVGGFLVEPGLEVSYSFNAYLSLGIYASYRYIRDSRGNSRSRGATGVYSPWTSNTAGAGFHALDSGLTLKASF